MERECCHVHCRSESDPCLIGQGCKAHQVVVGGHAGWNRHRWCGIPFPAPGAQWGLWLQAVVSGIGCIMVPGRMHRCCLYLLLREGQSTAAFRSFSTTLGFLTAQSLIVRRTDALLNSNSSSSLFPQPSCLFNQCVYCPGPWKAIISYWLRMWMVEWNSFF